MFIFQSQVLESPDSEDRSRGLDIHRVENRSYLHSLSDVREDDGTKPRPARPPRLRQDTIAGIQSDRGAAVVDALASVCLP